MKNKVFFDFEIDSKRLFKAGKHKNTQYTCHTSTAVLTQIYTIRYMPKNICSHT
jgi:hypothetical protein